MHWARLAVAGIALTIAAPAVAQMNGTDGLSFVQAVRDNDGSAAMALLASRGELIVNARDAKGDTALLVAVARRDEDWTAFLLQKGADPSLAARNGDTPLIVATRAGWQLGAEWLLGERVKVDGTNRMGETALIIAVQQRNLPLVRLLLSAGANPDKTDNAAGYSARDYAKRDNRARDILALMDSVQKAKSEDINDFKL